MLVVTLHLVSTLKDKIVLFSDWLPECYIQAHRMKKELVSHEIKRNQFMSLTTLFILVCLHFVILKPENKDNLKCRLQIYGQNVLV